MVAVAPARGAAVVVALFLLLATATQSLLAFYGLLARYVQVVSQPGIPALRLVLVVNLCAEAFLLLFHSLPFQVAPRVYAAWQRRRRRDRQQELPTSRSVAAADASTGETAAQEWEQEEQHSSSIGEGDVLAPLDAESPKGRLAAGGPLDNALEQHQLRLQPPLPEQGGLKQPQQRLPGSRLRLVPVKTTLRPPAVLVRGLSTRLESWQRQRPRLHRNLVLAALTTSFMGVCSLQMLAPGYLDVSIVQLTTQWTPLCIAVTQALLLRHRLPRSFWPAAVVMLGGAAMVIVPAIGMNEAGSLSTLRGWCGFIMAVSALVCTVIYYVLLQATRHMGFTAMQLQHLMACGCVLLFLPLTLPIDGADWSAQFAPWDATDWIALVALSTFCYVGAGVFMQLCVWKLGAPTAAMFFGLRLVFAVTLSTPILGGSAITTWVQILGVCITASAVTVYAALQWWASRQADRHGKLAAAAEGSDDHVSASQQGGQSSPAACARGQSYDQKPGVVLQAELPEASGAAEVPTPGGAAPTAVDRVRQAMNQ